MPDFISSKDNLEDRYNRMLEVLIAITTDPVLPYRMVLAYLATSRKRLNKGNSRRTMMDYVHQWVEARYLVIEDDTAKLTESGNDLLRKESRRIGRYMKNVDWGKWIQGVKDEENQKQRESRRK